MAKKVTSKGAVQAAFDVLCLAIYIIGGVAGVMYASVLSSDLTMWFYLAAGLFLILTGVSLVTKVTKPMENYETADA